jgi:hypothetical protein
MLMDSLLETIIRECIFNLTYYFTNFLVPVVGRFLKYALPIQKDRFIELINRLVKSYNTHYRHQTVFYRGRWQDRQLDLTVKQ